MSMIFIFLKRNVDGIPNIYLHSKIVQACIIKWFSVIFRYFYAQNYNCKMQAYSKRQSLFSFQNVVHHYRIVFCHSNWKSCCQQRRKIQYNSRTKQMDKTIRKSLQSTFKCRNQPNSTNDRRTRICYSNHGWQHEITSRHGPT